MNQINISKPIVWDSGKVNDYLHIIDIKQFGRHTATSVYIAEFDDGIVILDCGTSMDTRKILKYIKENGIPLEMVKYIIVSHHHFDHIGGLWKLYDEIKKSNPNVRIISSLITMKTFNNFENESHFIRSKKTWGILTGKFKKIDEDAFRIIKPNEYINVEEVNFKIIDTFNLNNTKIDLAILKTPGHASGHISSLFIKDRNADFLFFGEAAGGLAHSKNLKTIANSVAPDFNYKDYMQSLEKIQKLSPLNGGYAHFGLVAGKENVTEIIAEHESMMKEFRQKVIEYYSEKPETKYVFDKLTAFFGSKERIEGSIDEDLPEYQTFIKFFVSMLYGMMMDLGYRKD